MTVNDRQVCFDDRPDDKADDSATVQVVITCYHPVIKNRGFVIKAVIKGVITLENGLEGVPMSVDSVDSAVIQVVIALSPWPELNGSASCLCCQGTDTRGRTCNANFSEHPALESRLIPGDGQGEERMTQIAFWMRLQSFCGDTCVQGGSASTG